MKKISLLIVMSLFGASNLYAQNLEDCKKITNAKKRLDCFDSQQKLKESLAENEKSKVDAEKAKAEAEAKEEAENRKTQEALELKKAKFLSAANVALRAAKKFASRISVGISYREYYEPLADVKFEVDDFISGSHELENTKFSLALLKALKHYEMAGVVWKMKITNNGSRSPMTLTPRIIEMYPNANNSAYSFLSSRLIAYDKMLSIIWQAADEELDNAESALNDPT